MNLSLIDGDSLAYILGYTYRDASTEYMQEQVDSFMFNILSATSADTYLLFIGGSRCFRYELAKTKPYKGKRGEKAEWLQHWEPLIREYLVSEWKAIICNQIEADDAVSICWEAYRNDHFVTVCGCDKDLKQLHGAHYDYKKCQHLLLNELESARLFWTQMITGDVSDGIPGLPGKGAAFCEHLLKNYITSDEGLKEEVQSAYAKYGGVNYREMYQEQYSLLHMLRKPAYGFELPIPLPVPLFDPLTVKQVSSTPQKKKPISDKHFDALGL